MPASLNEASNDYSEKQASTLGTSVDPRKNKSCICCTRACCARKCRKASCTYAGCRYAWSSTGYMRLAVLWFFIFAANASLIVVVIEKRYLGACLSLLVLWLAIYALFVQLECRILLTTRKSAAQSALERQPPSSDALVDGDGCTHAPGACDVDGMRVADPGAPGRCGGGSFVETELPVRGPLGDPLPNAYASHGDTGPECGQNSLDLTAYACELGFEPRHAGKRGPSSSRRTCRIISTECMVADYLRKVATFKRYRETYGNIHLEHEVNLELFKGYNLDDRGNLYIGNKLPSPETGSGSYEENKETARPPWVKGGEAAITDRNSSPAGPASASTARAFQDNAPQVHSALPTQSSGLTHPEIDLQPPNRSWASSLPPPTVSSCSHGSVSPSPTEAEQPPEYVFSVGDRVRCRDRGKEWSTGTVKSVSPVLKIQKDGFSQAYSWDEVGGKRYCRYGSACTSKNDSEHCLDFFHPPGASDDSQALGSGALGGDSVKSGSRAAGSGPLRPEPEKNATSPIPSGDL